MSYIIKKLSKILLGEVLEEKIKNKYELQKRRNTHTSLSSFQEEENRIFREMRLMVNSPKVSTYDLQA